MVQACDHDVLFDGAGGIKPGYSPLSLQHSPLRDRLVDQPAHVEILHARVLEAVGGGESGKGTMNTLFNKLVQ